MSAQQFRTTILAIANEMINGEDTTGRINALARASGLDASTISHEVFEAVDLLND